MREHDTIRPIAWHDDGLWLLDQRRLPHTQHYLPIPDAPTAAQAIRDMVVRGAPAIGITAAYAAALAARQAQADTDDWRATMPAVLELLAQARPTAVNLHWALARMQQALDRGADWRDLLELAQRIQAEDVAANQHMGALGAAVLGEGVGVLTHCNTGSLATGGFGTALGVIRTAYAQGQLRRVFATETRPWLQGARLTVWELVQDRIPVSLIADSAAAHFMARGEIDWVIVGADRITANGDVANKIGTYALAIAARHHGVRVMVVAPWSTVDLTLATGADIPIEYRDGRELLAVIAQPPGELLQALDPAFDVTPAALIDVLVTERGVLHRPDTPQLAQLAAA